MRAPPNVERAPLADGGALNQENSRLAGATVRDNTRSHPRSQVAVIAKSVSAQLRVSLTSWRGQHKLEIREATAAIPGCFFPTPNGVTLDLGKIPELIAALQAAEAEARARGLLSKGRSA
jgi:hypothetical protein